MKRFRNSENRNKSSWKSRLVENTSPGASERCLLNLTQASRPGICILASFPVDSEHPDIGTACTQVVKWGKFVPAQKLSLTTLFMECNGVAFLPSNDPTWAISVWVKLKLKNFSKRNSDSLPLPCVPSLSQFVCEAQVFFCYRGCWMTEEANKAACSRLSQRRAQGRGQDHGEP